MRSETQANLPLFEMFDRHAALLKEVEELRGGAIILAENGSNDSNGSKTPV